MFEFLLKSRKKSKKDERNIFQKIPQPQYSPHYKQTGLSDVKNEASETAP